MNLPTAIQTHPLAAGISSALLGMLFMAWLLWKARNWSLPKLVVAILLVNSLDLVFQIWDWCHNETNTATPLKQQAQTPQSGASVNPAVSSLPTVPEISPPASHQPPASRLDQTSAPEIVHQHSCIITSMPNVKVERRALAPVRSHELFAGHFKRVSTCFQAFRKTVKSRFLSMKRSSAISS